jgi:hypothetical protein
MLRCTAVVTAICSLALSAAADPSGGALAAPGDCAQPSADFETPPLYEQPAGVSGSASEHFAPKGSTGLVGLLPLDLTRTTPTTLSGVTETTTDLVGGAVETTGDAVSGAVGGAADVVGATVDSVTTGLAGVAGGATSALGAEGLGSVAGGAAGSLGSDGLAGSALGATTNTVNTLTGTATGATSTLLGVVK